MDYPGNPNFKFDGGEGLAQGLGGAANDQSGFGWNYWIVLLVAVAILFGAFVLSGSGGVEKET